MSKGLKALEIIKNAMTIYVGCASNIYTRYPFECKDIEKELKALELVKKYHITPAFFTFNPTYNSYELNMSFYEDEELMSEEEYNLAKEVLNA